MHKVKAVIGVNSSGSPCQHCAGAALCLAHSAAPIDRYQLKRGENLVSPGDHCDALYMVHKGALKSCSVNEEGKEQIWSLYFSGEIFGLEGLDESHYSSSIAALLPSEVCVIPFSNLIDEIQSMPKLQRYFFKLMSHRYRIDLAVPRNTLAIERLSWFLLNLSTRLNVGDGFLDSFVLPLSRQEIANYLGLTMETVSRILMRLQRRRLIAVKGRRITICDMAQLKQLSGLW